MSGTRWTGGRRWLVALLLLGFMATAAVIGTAQAAQFPFPFFGHGHGHGQGRNSDVSCPAGRSRGRSCGRAEGRPAQQPDLVVNGACTVKLVDDYYYGNVNILDGGSRPSSKPSGNGTHLKFWASSIIVENGGSLIAGSATAPYGSRRRRVDHLYLRRQPERHGPVPEPDAGRPGERPRARRPLSEQGDEGHEGDEPDERQVRRDSRYWPLRHPARRLDGQRKDGRFQMPGEGNIKDAFYRYGPMYGDELCSDGKTKWSKTTFCPLDKTSRYASAIGSAISATRSWRCLMAALCSSSATRDASAQSHSAERWVQGVFGNLGQKFPQGQKEESSGGTDTDKEARGLAAQNRQRRIPSLAAPDAAGCAWRQICRRRARPASWTLSATTGDKWLSPNDPKDVPNQLVITPTDYLPGHWDPLTISKVGGNTVTFTGTVEWPHSGTKYPIASKLGDGANSNKQRFTPPAWMPICSTTARTRAPRWRC